MGTGSRGIIFWDERGGDHEVTEIMVTSEGPSEALSRSQTPCIPLKGIFLAQCMNISYCAQIYGLQVKAP